MRALTSRSRLAAMQLVEEPIEAIEVRRVKGGTAQCADLERCLLEALHVATGEDDIGSLGACSSGGFESDSGAATDHADGLPNELGFATCPRDRGWGGHGFLLRCPARFLFRVYPGARPR